MGSNPIALTNKIYGIGRRRIHRREWWGRRRQAREAESKKEIEMRKTFIAVDAAGLAG
jgi:hypothetical protein